MHQFDHKDISIYEIAKAYGAEPKSDNGGGAVQCKNNPLRHERTSSLVIYPASNSWFDFGTNEGGDVCDFVMIHDGCGFKDAIQKLKDFSGHVELNYKPRREPTKQTNYMAHETVKKYFDSHMDKITIDAPYLSEIIPQFAIDFLKENKKQWDSFSSKLRYYKAMNTLVVGIFEDNKIIGFRYRKKDFDGDIRKWVAESSMRVSVPYLNENIGSYVLVVEGTHDFITADALGFETIGLPNAGFKLDAKLVEGRECLFIPDNDKAGIEGMQKTIANCGGSGVVFDHAKFSADNNIKEQKDFSDYAMLFKTRDEFIKALDHHFTSNKHIKNDAKTMLEMRGKHLTREFLDSLDEIEYLIDGVIPKGLFTIVVGDSGAGKTSTMLSFANKAFELGTIDQLVVMDADMPPVLLRDRLNKLMDRNGDENIKYYCNVLSDSDDMMDMIDTLTNSKVDCSRMLFIFDTLKDFVTSPNDEKVIQIMMTRLKAFRNNTGATIILLHHTKKTSALDKELVYTGSNAIKGSCDELVYLYRKEDTVFFKPSNKTRVGLTPKAFIIDHVEMSIEEIEFVEDEEEKPIRNRPTDLDDDEKAEMIYTFLVENGDTSESILCRSSLGMISEAKAKKIIWDDRYKGKLWRVEKMTPKGWKFIVIPKSSTTPTEIKYEMPSFLAEDLF